MRAIMVMFDSLNRHFLEPYGCEFTKTPNFKRLARHSVQFETCYAGSLPCMPARRELHTGRYNFLHRSWGPIEPFDDSMPQLLKQKGIHSHLASDHGHYWEDGGATYHTRYSTWENFRGQEGDPWKGVAGSPETEEENLVQFAGYRKLLYEQDRINRSYLTDMKNHPQVKTFEAGLEFVETNRDKDKWFLQIECFDPHEPFFSYPKYKELYPHDYMGKKFDWPDYAPVKETADEVEHGRMEYAALLSMCDEQLGRVLDAMDAYDMWKDTMLIVNTDHGFLLGEHGFWAKNYMPLYEEISHIPLFLWDPRYRIKGEKRKSLVQTIDLPVTILNFFGITVPKDMLGKDLSCVLTEDKIDREGVLFGIHGAHICCTDGKYVYMKAPVSEENAPLYEYTLMPAHMVGFFSETSLKTLQVSQGFEFTKGLPLMRFDSDSKSLAYQYGDLLFDLENDKHQMKSLKDSTIEAGMKKLMIELLKQNDAPEEQYIRLGLEEQ